MDAGEGNMKERMLMIEMKYSVLKKEMEGDRCGWSEPDVSIGITSETKKKTCCR
jgi:hypothetical protein